MVRVAGHPTSLNAPCPGLPDGYAAGFAFPDGSHGLDLGGVQPAATGMTQAGSSTVGRLTRDDTG